jgi:hypothetical protein
MKRSVARTSPLETHIYVRDTIPNRLVLNQGKTWRDARTKSVVGIQTKSAKACLLLACVHLTSIYIPYPYMRGTTTLLWRIRTMRAF